MLNSGAQSRYIERGVIFLPLLKLGFPLKMIPWSGTAVENFLERGGVLVLRLPSSVEEVADFLTAVVPFTEFMENMRMRHLRLYVTPPFLYYENAHVLD